MMSCISNGQDLQLELFATNLERPVNIKRANDERLFVIEQQGFVSIINADGTVNATPFLNIDSKVGPIYNIGDARGLLGLAFHPDYSTNSCFYVNYINNNGNSVISRFSRHTTNPSLANASSEFSIRTYTQPFSNQNCGDLVFADDGYLSIVSGDGGSGGVPQNNGQNTNSLLGKLLRIDVNNSISGQNYSVPADNPCAGDPNSRGEIWVYGLRNPWKFSCDRLNGDIWIADVGQNKNEEINQSFGTTSGLNYGWRCYEANSSYNVTYCPDQSALSFPVAYYNHFSNGEFKCSITGGYRYRGSDYPSFNGWYFFADYCSEEIGYLIYDGKNDVWKISLAQFIGNWTAFREDINGELYLSDIQTGNIYKLKDSALGLTNEIETTVSLFPNPVTDVLKVIFPSVNSADSSQIAIYTTQGKIVRVLRTDSEVVQTIDNEVLNSDFYIVQITSTNGKQSTHKLVVN